MRHRVRHLVLNHACPENLVNGYFTKKETEAKGEANACLKGHTIQRAQTWDKDKALQTANPRLCMQPSFLDLHQLPLNALAGTEDEKAEQTALLVTNAHRVLCLEPAAAPVA